MSDAVTPRAIALLVTLGFFGVIAAILWRGLPTEGGDALLVLLGALGGAFGTVISYYFGSSRGSERKTEMLARATPSVAPSVGDAETKEVV